MWPAHVLPLFNFGGSLKHMCLLYLQWAAAASTACVFSSALPPAAKQSISCVKQRQIAWHDTKQLPAVSSAAPARAATEHVADQMARRGATACRRASASAMAQAKAAAEHLARHAAAAQQELCALKLQQQSGQLGHLALSRDGPLGQSLCMLCCDRTASSHVSAGS